MDRKQKESIEAYGRVDAFLADHPLKAPGTYGAPQRIIGEVVVQLAGYTAAQSEGRREFNAGTQRLRALYRELRERHLRPIAAIARAVKRETPGIQLALRLPGGQVSATRLLAEAKAIRNAAAVHEASFVENGRPADFLAQLDAASTALHACLVARGRRRGERMAARGGMRAAIRRGRNAVDMLNAAVLTSFANDPFVLAKWRAARRVVLVPSSGSQAEAELSAEAA